MIHQAHLRAVIMFVTQHSTAFKGTARRCCHVHEPSVGAPYNLHGVAIINWPPDPGERQAQCAARQSAVFCSVQEHCTYDDAECLRL
jgi:hypothetical protein